MFGKTKTWKIVYYPKILNAGIMGVAFVEAETRSDAIFAFQTQYAGQFSTISSCTEVF